MALSVTSSNFSNMTTSEPPPLASLDSSVLVASVLRSLSFLVGFPGNIAVIILKPNWQQLSRLTQCLLMNLAMSDLLCLVTLPVWIYTQLCDWTLGVATCKILAFVTYCSIYSSLLTVTALCVQRYMQVVQQQRCLQLKRRLLILLWIISGTFSIPQLVVRQTINDQQQKTFCVPKYSSKHQQVAVLLTECIVAFTSFAVTSCIYFFLKRKLNQSVFFNSPWTSKLITSISVTFFIVWMPYTVFNLVTVGGILKNNKEIIKFYISGLKVFSAIIHINCCLNPLLYAFAPRMCGQNTNRTSGNSNEPPIANVAVP